SSTSFQGTKLLNGTFDFTVSAQASFVADLEVNAAKLNFGENRDVQVLVTKSAQRAGLFLSLGGGQLDLSSAESKFVIEVAGAKGSRQFTFASGTTISAMKDAINTFTQVTGVSAGTSGTGIVLKSDA